MFSAHAGLNASQVQGDGLAGFNKLNLALGIGVQRNFSDKFGGVLEINLLQKGSRKNADPENNDLEEYKMALLYAQVPLLFNYTHNEKFSFLGGPAMGFLLNAQEEDFFGEIANTPAFNSIELSAILGVRYHLSERFQAELRFDQSILPIRSRESEDFNRLVGRQFNTVLGVWLSYSIR
jgi:hypothetical protein